MIAANIDPLEAKLRELKNRCSMCINTLGQARSVIALLDTNVPTADQRAEMEADISAHAAAINTTFNEAAAIFQSPEPV